MSPREGLTALRSDADRLAAAEDAAGIIEMGEIQTAWEKAGPEERAEVEAIVRDYPDIVYMDARGMNFVDLWTQSEGERRAWAIAEAHRDTLQGLEAMIALLGQRRGHLRAILDQLDEMIDRWRATRTFAAEQAQAALDRAQASNDAMRDKYLSGPWPPEPTDG